MIKKLKNASLPFMTLYTYIYIIFISGLVATYLGTKAAADVITDLKDKGIAITDSAKESIENTLTKKRDVGAPVGISIEDILEEGLSRLNPFD